MTGSSGLIGQRLCRALSREHRVVGLDASEPGPNAHETWVECDLTSDASVRDALAQVRERVGEEIASAVHLAAYYDFSGEPSPLYRDLTVEGTRRFLRTARELLRLEQFVFSSSLLVMKAVEPGEVVDETSPVEAEWDYPRSKLEAEDVIRAERGDVPAVLLRIAGVYDEDGHSIPLAQQLKRIREKDLESFFFPGDPDRGQPFVHLDDLIACFQAVIRRRGELDGVRTYLIGEPDVVGYGEVQDIAGDALHGREWPTIRIPRSLAKAGAWVQDKTPGVDPFIKPWMIDLADAHVPISIERARSELGWEPRRRLRDVLPEMARRLDADPQGWYAENGLAEDAAGNGGSSG